MPKDIPGTPMTDGPKKEIDHILSHSRNMFLSYRVYRSTEPPANSDHHVVLVVASIRLEVNRKPPPPRQCSLNVQSLIADDNIAAQYSVAVSNSFQALDSLQ